jgi:cytochrome c oxidase subunit IV
MADKGKKSKGANEAAKKAAPVADTSSAKAEPVAHAKEAVAVAAAADHAHDDHDHAAHAKVGAAAHGPAAHGHKSHVKEYLIIFAVLTVLTILEVALAQIPGISKKLLAVALVGLALTKAGIVALYYMHLKSETRVLKLTVAVPLAAPTIYAVVLMTEAAWRLTR